MPRNKPQTKIFILANGIWKDVAGDSGTLAEFLSEYDLLIDDRTQFARIYDYENNICIFYKVVNAIKIQIDIWQIS